MIREHLKSFLPRRARGHGSWFNQFYYALVGLASVYEGLVIFLSLGTLTCEARAWVLFRDWEDDEPKTYTNYCGKCGATATADGIHALPDGWEMWSDDQLCQACSQTIYDNLRVEGKEWRLGEQ